MSPTATPVSYTSPVPTALRSFRTSDNKLVFIDTTGYEEVRAVFMSNCASCSVKIRFYIEGMLIDETTVTGATVHTQNLRLPGTMLMINMEDPGATPANVKLAVFGRP